MICPLVNCPLDRGAANPCARKTCPFRKEHPSTQNRFEDTERIQMGEYMKKKYPHAFGDES